MTGKMDLTGQRYGRLLVTGEAPPAGYTRRWNCACDCGEELVVRMTNLRSGHTTSCGCLQAERTSAANADDLTGHVFGRLTVLRRADNKRAGSRHIFWSCQCECGRQTIVDGVKLRDDTTASCGCRREDAGRGVQAHNAEHQYKDGVFIPVLTSKLRSDNSTGVKGVSRMRKKDGQVVFRAAIQVGGKTYYLGEHDTIHAAAAARKAGEEKYHKPYLESNEDDQAVKTRQRG